MTPVNRYRMKEIKLFVGALLIALGMASCSTYSVYSVKSQPKGLVPGGFIYALPYTQIRVAVNFEHHDYSAAPYAEFANELLGISGKSIDSIYAIKSIEVSTQNQADPKLYYFVDPNKVTVSIDSRGLLSAIGSFDSQNSESNDAFVVEKTSDIASSVASYNLYDRVDTFYTRKDKPGKPSFVSSKKDVKSLRQRAVAAAKDIEEIQEKKRQLVFGEFEGNYNGDAVRFLYEQLTERENQLLKFFTGNTTTETVVFWVDPKNDKSLIDSQEVELFRFSPMFGLVDSTNDYATVVRCQIRSDNRLKLATRFIRFRTSSFSDGKFLDNHTFKYRVPETATVIIYGREVGAKDNEIDFCFEKQVKISQFGSIANLPTGRFQAKFDPVTGDLIYFDRK